MRFAVGASAMGIAMVICTGADASFAERASEADVQIVEGDALALNNNPVDVRERLVELDERSGRLQGYVQCANEDTLSICTEKGFRRAIPEGSKKAAVK